MKKSILITTISLSNLFYFFWWIKVYNKFSVQSARVEYFLDKFYIFNSVEILNGILMLFTLVSLVILNLGRYKNDLHALFRILCTGINIAFLLFTVWSYL
ncbi:MAG TPA: hypothetical protein DCE78_01825 [Bacteroidetes bacterium]|nr:hypothetical protein [Bacteroidota bacterium]